MSGKYFKRIDFVVKLNSVLAVRIFWLSEVPIAERYSWVRLEVGLLGVPRLKDFVTSTSVRNHGFQ